MISQFKIIEVTPNNVQEETLFCIKDIKSPGFKCKQGWFEKQYIKGLRLKILKGADGKMIGFIEYVPASNAWHPIEAEKFMFVHCITVYSKKDRSKGYGVFSLLHDGKLLEDHYLSTTRLRNILKKELHPNT